MYKFKNYILILLILLSTQVKSQNEKTKLNNFEIKKDLKIITKSARSNRSNCSFTKECQDERYFKVSALSGKKYTRVRVLDESTGNVRQHSTTDSNTLASVDWLKRGRKYKVIVYGRERNWFLWSAVCQDYSYIYVPEGVSGNISSNKSKYCEDEPIYITPNLNNNSSIGVLWVEKNGSNVFNTEEFSYNSFFNLKQVLSTPNKYGNTYNLTSGNYSIIFKVNEPNSACSKNFRVNFEIKNNTPKEPIITFNYKDTYLVNTYTIHNICNSRNNDGLWLRINRSPINECDRISEKFSITISNFNEITGNSSNIQSVLYNIPSESISIMKLKNIFPSYIFSNNMLYKMEVSGQIYYFRLYSWSDCIPIANQNLRINENRRRN